MFSKLKFLFIVVFAIVGVQCSFAQIDLKELRAKPDTNIVEQSQSPLSNLSQVLVPIPRLDLEVDYWKHWTKLGVNLNQAAFSDNWNSGGTNSFALGATGWHKSEYKKNNFTFMTEIDLKYGKIKYGFLSGKNDIKYLPKKNNDRIFWDNSLAYSLSKNWALYVSLTFESQFDAGYDYAIKDSVEYITGKKSNFMAPGYLTESFGLEYKPDNTFSVRFGTGTARQTFILDDEIAPPITATEQKFGVDPGKKFANDLAFQITANLDRNLSKNLNIKSRYNLLANYEDINDPAHRFDLTLTAKVTNLVNVALNGIVLYDSTVDPKVQFSESLSMGIIYSLPR